jgi:hypothetical protein
MSEPALVSVAGRCPVTARHWMMHGTRSKAGVWTTTSTAHTARWADRHRLSLRRRVRLRTPLRCVLRRTRTQSHEPGFLYFWEDGDSGGGQTTGWSTRPRSPSRSTTFWGRKWQAWFAASSRRDRARSRSMVARGQAGSTCSRCEELVRSERKSCCCLNETAVSKQVQWIRGVSRPLLFANPQDVLGNAE